MTIQTGKNFSINIIRTLGLFTLYIPLYGYLCLFYGLSQSIETIRDSIGDTKFFLWRKTMTFELFYYSFIAMVIFMGYLIAYDYISTKDKS